MPVLQLDDILLTADDSATELCRAVLDDQALLSGDLRRRHWPARRRSEHVLVVSPAPHRHRFRCLLDPAASIGQPGHYAQVPRREVRRGLVDTLRPRQALAQDGGRFARNAAIPSAASSEANSRADSSASSCAIVSNPASST